jgi:GMP synthase (glutamine-hydrolysing)
MMATMQTRRQAIAIRHVSFETLGTFETELERAGYELTYADVANGGLAILDALVPDLLIVLGGPIGVYEADTYPFLITELALIKSRLRAGLPLLGICLGAQLIAAALDARVASTGVKEIGFAPLALTDAGANGPLRHLADVPVLHWHGDAFELPVGATLLATTPVCNQAFAVGRNVLGLQFHPEADTTGDLEAWLIGHACELAGAAINPRIIRTDARRHGSALADAGRAMFAEWLSHTHNGTGSARW